LHLSELQDTIIAMDADLAAFFDPLPIAFHEDVDWGNGRTPLHVTTYLTQRLPPLEYVTSVRAILLNEVLEVLVCNNADGETHIVPGGRREPGEVLEETLRREVFEETGWEIENICQLGVWHFHHLAPKQEGYRFPYPDFLQIIYGAKAMQYDAAKRIPDDYESDSSFVPISQLNEQLFAQPSQMRFVQQMLGQSPK
jgi:ADP-ribose pyrophosphatase YjhB (NUDIX family)